MLDPKDHKCSAHDWWAFEGACGKLIAPIARRILGQTVSSSSCERNWSSYSFVHNKSRNRLEAKRAEDLVYVYTNSRVMAEGKEKDKKKWYADNVDLEDSDSAPEGGFEDPADFDSDDTDDGIDDGMDDGNLGVEGSYGGSWEHSPNFRRQEPIPDPEEVYNFREVAEEEDEPLRNTPSIAAFMNGDGLLNSENLLRKSSTVEAVENVLAVKACNQDGIGAREAVSPARSQSRKGHSTGSGKDGEAAKEAAADASLAEPNAYVKEKSNIGKLDPISSTGAMRGGGNSSGLGRQSSMRDCPSRALFESNSKNVEPTKLSSSRRLVSLSKKMRPQLKPGDGCASESDANEPLTTIWKPKPECPRPREDALSHGKQSRAVTKTKGEPSGRPKSGRTGPVAVSEQKKKNTMQPFAQSPLDTKQRPRTPHDGKRKKQRIG